MQSIKLFYYRIIDFILSSIHEMYWINDGSYIIDDPKNPKELVFIDVKQDRLKNDDLELSGLNINECIDKIINATNSIIDLYNENIEERYPEFFITKGMKNIKEEKLLELKHQTLNLDKVRKNK